MKGQAFLALIFLLGGSVILIGATLVFLGNSFINTGYGYRAEVQAEAAATSGADDALLQLDRDPTFAPGTYSVVVGSSTATVVVTRNSPSTGMVTILSSATVSARTRKINVVAAVNSTTSQVSVISRQTIQ